MANELAADHLGPLIHAAIGRCELDLDGLVVLTEAASGPYVVTPLLAALAGARRVLAVTRDSPWGTAAEVCRLTEGLALELGITASVLRVTTAHPRDLAAEADIVTNSGHLRPLDQDLIDRLKITAVIPLMYEAWELRDTDLDLAACRRRGIAVAGTNECHPAVGVFPFLGDMAAQLFADGNLQVAGSSLLIICNNPFAPFLAGGLRELGADVRSATDPDAALAALADHPEPFDGVLFAATPGPAPVCDAPRLLRLDRVCGRPLFAQLWGDLERPAGEDLRFVPATPPPRGHMGLLPSALGPEPVIRLQSGGLKVGEILARQRLLGLLPEEAEAAVEAWGWGQRL